MTFDKGKSGISVIIPAYNAERFVHATIESVLAQTHPVQEIIVVDDGSTDSTPDILASFGARIRTIRQPNQGPSAARNNGIAAASGEWLAFLDSDDLWLPNFSRTMLASINTSSADVGVIVCGWQYVDFNGNKIGVSVLPTRDEITFQDLLLGNRFLTTAAVVRQGWVNRAGCFDPKLKGCEDWDIWLRLAHIGCRFRTIASVLVSYRQVVGSLSRNVHVMRKDGMAVLDKIYALPELSSDAAELREKAYGFVRLWAGASYYEAGCSEIGFQEFRDALIEFPVLLSNLETYHAMICAEQPRHFKGTALNLDLRAAGKRLQTILYAVAQSSHSPSQSLQPRAEMLAYSTLAEYSFRQGHRRQALRHAMHSLRLADDRSAIKQGTRLIAKAIVQPIPKESENDLFARS